MGEGGGGGEGGAAAPKKKRETLALKLAVVCAPGAVESSQIKSSRIAVLLLVQSWAVARRFRRAHGSWAQSADRCVGLKSEARK